MKAQSVGALGTQLKGNRVDLRAFGRRASFRSFLLYPVFSASVQHHFPWIKIK